MLRPYVLQGHNVDSCVALAPRPTAGHQTLDLGMVVRIHRGQFPSPQRVSPLEETDELASDPDDGRPGAPYAGAGSPDSPNGVLGPPCVRGRPVSPLPEIGRASCRER